MNALEVVPATLKKFVDPAVPSAMRAMAAKGLVPLPPRDLIFVQCLLVHSDEPAIAQAADKSLREHPEAILKPIVQSDLPALVFDALADRVLDKPALLEGLALNKAVSDDTLARIVPQLPEAIVSILFQNEERILRSAPFVLALKAHPQASKAAIDRMFDLLVRSAVIFSDVPEYVEAIARLSNEERMAVADKIEVPPDLIDPAFTANKVNDDLTEIEAAPDEENPGENIVPEPLLKRLQSMSIAQKVAIALKGNKEVRTALLRETNKLVATAAIKNPRITEQEVLQVAASRGANEEVIRLISINREWTRSYGVKFALVQNPKTPLGVAMRFLPLLNPADLKNIAKSKNLPQAIANQAKTMLSRASK